MKSNTAYGWSASPRYTHRCPVLVHREPRSRTGTGVSSVWMTRDWRTISAIRSTSGWSRAAAAATHPPRVDLEMSTPWRASIPYCRYSGRWSANFETATWASRPGPGNHLSMGWGGSGAVVMVGVGSSAGSAVRLQTVQA